MRLAAGLTFSTMPPAGEVRAISRTGSTPGLKAASSPLHPPAPACTEHSPSSLVWARLGCLPRTHPPKAQAEHVPAPWPASQAPGRPAHFHTPLLGAGCALSHLPAGSQDSSGGLTQPSQVVHKTPTPAPSAGVAPHALLACPAALLFRGAVGREAVWILLCTSYCPGAGGGEGPETRIPQDL